jgi:hypothetical protein
MADEGWIPYEYFDETIPDVRRAPRDWIGRYDDGAAGLLDFYGEGPARRLSEGDEVRFIEYRDFGAAVLTVAGDGTWSVDRAMPDGANCVWCADLELGGRDIAQMMADWREGIEGSWASPFSESGPVTVVYGWWSDPLPFRFTGAAGCEFVPAWPGETKAVAPDEPLVDHVWFSQASRDVLAERRRQIEAEGFTCEHDDATYHDGEMASAASCIAFQASRPADAEPAYPTSEPPPDWPWEARHGG